MRRALALAAFTALAVARPETYKEKEDFQYSRSSSDDGTKSGFYGAQRGNMGGNYERAHNMDALAQHQMGGLVRTVEGELGDGAKQRSGSVFSAANSRGIYGSGHYDLSNLEGRNFQEGTSFGDSQSHSSLSAQNAGYGSHSQTYSSAANSAFDSRSHNTRYHGYQTTANTDQALLANNMQSADNLQSLSQYSRNQEALGTGYQLQSGYQAQSGYDQAAANSHLSNAYGTNYRLVGATPVRVFVRPGGRVAVPLAAQSYDNSQNSASTFNQNAINSEAEVLSNDDKQNVYKPTNNAKHYESSYSYRKEWEKHDTKPVTGGFVMAPTVNPYPANSELYEDSQTANRAENEREASLREASLHEAQNVQSSSQYRGYNVKSAGSSQSRQQAAYSAGAHSAASDTLGASGVAGSHYTNGASNYDSASASLNAASLNAANLNTQVEDFGSKPKSYQSSYSYHKSWERQGDPYVIKPSTNGLYTAADTQASQRLTASSLNQGVSGYGSHQYGAHHHQSHQGYLNSNGDCDEQGHVRVARSYYVDHDQPQEYIRPTQELGQQSQNQEDFNQHSQNLEDFGQQSQNLEDLGQQSQNLEDFGQQSQNLENLGQQPQHLEDFGQQSQNLEDLGQQSQNLDDFGQQPQNLENLGQQPQHLEDFGQQSQNLEDLGQQSQNLEDFGQQSQNLEDLGQQTQDVGQLTPTNWGNLEQAQQAQTGFDRIENSDQQTQNQWDQQNQTELGQQTQNTWSTIETKLNDNNAGQATEGQLNNMEDTRYNHYDSNTAFQTQGWNYHVNHPALHRQDTKQDTVNLNSLAHSIFNEQSQEKTELGKDDIQIHYTQTERTNAPTDQQIHNFWSVDQNNQNMYVPILPQYANAQNVQFNTGHSYGHHYGFTDNTAFTGYNANPWMFTQTGSDNPNNNFQSNVYVNSYGNTQTHLNRNDHSTHETRNIRLNPTESSNTGLMNLWNLINDIEKETTLSNQTDSFHSNQENKTNTDSYSTSDFMQSFDKNLFNTEEKPVHSTAFSPSTPQIKLETTTTKQVKLQSHDVERGDIGPEKQRPQEEVGRGDIGPEDSSYDNSNSKYKPLEIIEVKPKTTAVYKTPEEIESLSLIGESNKTTLVNALSSKKNERTDEYNQSTSVLSVIGISENPLQNFEQGSRDVQRGIHVTISTTPKPENNYVNSNLNTEQHNTNQSFENLGQQVENNNQHNHNEFEAFELQSVDQHSRFLQHNTEQQFNSLDQQNIDTKYHHSHDIEQGPDEIQQHFYNQFETLGQQSENLNQQSFNQFEDDGQQSVDIGQHQGFDDLNLEHGPDEMQQQFETLGQKSENLNQQSLKQFENDNQKPLNLGQHQKIYDFGQQHVSFQQESMNDFGQNEQLPQEPYVQLDHQNENLNQSQKELQLEDWVQVSQNWEQQSPPDHVREPTENLQQEQVKPYLQPPVFHREGREPHVTEPADTPEIITQISTNVVTLAEKVGFWNKVSSKFATAKGKVKSWFSSS